MFNQLFKLFQKSRNTVPLEDFTTELLAGALNSNKLLKHSFCKDFLKLPDDDYTITTQAKYDLKNIPNCIIDILIKSKNVICFIENKVNAGEGKGQLDKYIKVLDSFSGEGKKTYLFYCTKNHDPKEINSHNFFQYRWFQVAKFLKQHKYHSDKIVVHFLNYLESKGMNQDLKLTAKDFIALENLQRNINIATTYLERVRPLFKDIFKSQTDIINGIKTEQIVRHNRLIYYYKDIIGNKGWSELKYGIQLQTPNIYTGIWIDKNNNYYNEFEKFTESLNNDFIKLKFSSGMAIELKQDISIYLNDENIDDKISNWYKSSFYSFAELIEQMKADTDIEYNIDIVR